jgi:hypothetical protein
MDTANLPKSTMDYVWWNFQGGPYPTREALATSVDERNDHDARAWDASAVAVPAPRVILRLRHIEIFAESEHWKPGITEVPIVGSAVNAVTQLDVLWALQSFVDETGPVSEDRCFEGLELVHEPLMDHGGNPLDESDQPIYSVVIGT